MFNSLMFKSLIKSMAPLAVVLFGLAVYLLPGLAQDEVSNPAPSSSPKVIFVTPPSYLEMLNAQARPRSIGSLPRLDAPTAPAPNVTVTYTTTTSSSARPQIRSTTTTTCVEAPEGVRYVAPISSHQSDQIQIKKGPVLQGFTVKRGKVSLRDLSRQEAGGLNNKWLELKERELVEKSMFEPPGSPPHVNPY
jgi:hypothetical protein